MKQQWYINNPDMVKHTFYYLEQQREEADLHIREFIWANLWQTHLPEAKAKMKILNNLIEELTMSYPELRLKIVIYDYDKEAIADGMMPS